MKSKSSLNPAQFLHRALFFCFVLLLSIGCARLRHSPPGANHPPPSSESEQPASGWEWFSVPLEVTGLAPDAAHTPTAVEIDLSELLESVGGGGLVDERTIRLLRREGARETEVPVQFSPTPQPRFRERLLLPDTPRTVSFAGEFAVTAVPPEVKVRGELAWVAQADAQGTAAYTLRFGAPKAGRAIQVPFGPHNFRVFDEAGRTTSPRWFPRMQIRPSQPFGGWLEIFDGEQLVTRYHTGPGAAGMRGESFRRPFFYPLLSVDGHRLTDFGKPHDPTLSHAHHYSLWIAHMDVNGRDFWSERGGIIQHEQIELQEDGPVFCRLIHRTRWLWEGEPLVNERRTFTFHAAEGLFRLVDVELEYAPAGAQPVVFGKTSFGFLAVRVAASMTVFDGAGQIRNARGDVNESGVHLQHAEWLDQSGPVAPGNWAGIAIFDHPENPGHPNGWHCRNDGWAGASANLAEPKTLRPGETLRLRYRLLIHAGDARTGEVQRHWEEFNVRPAITLPTAAR